MKLHVLDLGTLRLDPNYMVGFSVTVNRSNPVKSLKLLEVPVSGYCIDHPDGRILFDLGCHPKAMGPNGRWPAHLQESCAYYGGEECGLPHRLEQLGLGPNDIRYAVLSHLHNDHAGCVEFFKKTKLIVHEDEFSAAFRSYGLKEKNGYVPNDIAEWAKHDLDWRLVGQEEGDLALADGLDILNLGKGHSFGMLGLRLSLREAGSIILASDAINCAQNYEPPARLPGVLADIAGYTQAIARIRRIAKHTNSKVWFGHDAAQFATLRKSTEGHYE